MLGIEPRSAEVADDWRIILQRYLVFIAGANLVWETAHLPLYTIWATGDVRELAFAVVHCTAGDVLIATSSVVLALLLAGAGWPVSQAARLRVATLAVIFGVGYTVFSEWLNIVVRRSWAYSSLMPVVPVIDTGVSPIAQWVVIPLMGLWWARRSFVSRGLHP